MNDDQVLKHIIEVLTFAKDSDWTQVGYRKKLFVAFKHAPKDPFGIPALNGGEIEHRIEVMLGEESKEFLDIKDSLSRLADAWDEWRFAVHEWLHAKTTETWQ